MSNLETVAAAELEHQHEMMLEIVGKIAELKKHSDTWFAYTPPERKSQINDVHALVQRYWVRGVGP